MLKKAGKMKKTAYAALTAAIWIFLESSAFCAEEGEQAGEAERVTTEAVNVEAVYEKEMLKEAPETKTLITREDIDRKAQGRFRTRWPPNRIFRWARITWGVRRFLSAARIPATP